MESSEFFDLKDCPFCGGKAELQQVLPFGDMAEHYYAACLECRASVVGSNGPAFKTEKEAAEAWNSRVGDDRLLTMTHRWEARREHNSGYRQALQDVVQVVIRELKNAD